GEEGGAARRWAPPTAEPALRRPAAGHGGCPTRREGTRRRMTVFTDILAAGLRFTTTIQLAASGAVFTQKVGIWNVALEGYMLTSAFTAVWVSYETGSPWLALGAGVAAGTVAGLLMAFVVVTLGADEIIAGLAINLLASGGTKFLLPLVFPGFQGAVVSDKIVPLPGVDIPGLDSVPILKAFNHQSPLVWAA